MIVTLLPTKQLSSEVVHSFLTCRIKIVSSPGVSPVYLHVTIDLLYLTHMFANVPVFQPPDMGRRLIMETSFPFSQTVQGRSLNAVTLTMSGKNCWELFVVFSYRVQITQNLWGLYTRSPIPTEYWFSVNISKEKFDHERVFVKSWKLVYDYENMYGSEDS